MAFRLTIWEWRQTGARAALRHWRYLLLFVALCLAMLTGTSTAARSNTKCVDANPVWHTFLGGNGMDRAFDVTTDSSGHVYLIGDSDGWGTPIRLYTSSGDAFVAELDSSGNLLWHTFLGGSRVDIGYGIAVDDSGNVYVTGRSDAAWGSPIRSYTDDADAFVAKLDSSGNLVWQTFLGGARFDSGSGIAVDENRNVYVTGWSYATWGAPIRNYGQARDGFVARLDGNGNLIWNTFLGGQYDDGSYDIDTDGSGNLYVAGDSSLAWGMPVRAFTVGSDAFAARLDGGGNLVWHTFLGGAGSDYSSGVSLHAGDALYVTGSSGATWGSPVRPFSAGANDAFAVRLDDSGRLIWNTFLGGSGADAGAGIAADGSGKVFLAGISSATWGSPLNAFAGGQGDAFVARLDGSGILEGHTFVGSGGADYGYAITTNGDGSVNLAGESDATWGVPVRAYTAEQDAFGARTVVEPPFKLCLPLILR